MPLKTDFQIKKMLFLTYFRVDLSTKGPNYPIFVLSNFYSQRKIVNVVNFSVTNENMEIKTQKYYQ